MTPAQQAEYDAYLRCAKKAEQKADELARKGCAGHARTARELQLSFQSMASALRRQSTSTTSTEGIR